VDGVEGNVQGFVKGEEFKSRSIVAINGRTYLPLKAIVTCWSGCGLE